MASSKPRPVHEVDAVVIAIAPDEAKRLRQEMSERLDALAKARSDERSEAIRYRASSGIETDWEEDELHYDGIDEANRGEHSSAWRSRPAGQAVTKKKGNLQSSIFLNITRPAVNIAASRVCNILQPRVSLEPTPVPELIGLSKGEVPRETQQQLLAQSGGNTEQAAATVGRAMDEAAQVMAEAKQKADKAKKRMEDWFVEGRYYAANRLMIKDSAKVGTGILKGPVPERVKRSVVKDGNIVILEETKPVTRRTDYWNFYPDPACGENIHDGSFTWERDSITRKGLRALKGGDYLDDQIDLVLAEGPMRAIAPTKQKPVNLEVGKGPFEIWYRYGDLTKDDMEAAGCECEDGASVPALLTMVNEHVIKVTLNPLDNGEFPYDVFAWPQKRKGMPWGTGIARAGRTPQKIVAAAVRAMMDNAGRAAGPQVIKGTQITANDQTNGISPWKLWDYAEDGDMDDVRKAFAFIAPPMMQQELSNIIQMGLRWMEESTNMPMLLQGNQGSAPDLVGVVEILNANAGEFLRDLGSSYDDDVSEPHGRRYYDWLLQHGPDDEKGDFILDTRGASVKVERLLQDQELLKAMQMSLQPAFKKSPQKFMDEYLLSRHFDPKKFDYTEEEMKAMQQQQPPPDPSIEVAQIRAKSQAQIEQIRAEAETQAMQANNQHEAQIERMRQEFEMAQNDIDRQLASQELASEERRDLEKQKVLLASLVAKLKVQERMASVSERNANDRAVAGHSVEVFKHRAKQVAPAAVEPLGKAEAGKSFYQ